MAELTIALAVFVGTHFLLSHPLRAPLVRAIGAGAFQGLYSLVALATFGWAIFAFRRVPATEPYWLASEGLWIAATFIMLIASILLVGSFFGNPALPQPGAAKLAAAPARGVFAITRHPMMWSFALWALAHALVAPNQATLILCGFVAFLALVGAAGQDHKKAVVMGEGWRDWASRTSYWPFGLQLGERSSWREAWPGRTIVLGGIALWLVASWVHPLLGVPAAGPWHWLG